MQIKHGGCCLSACPCLCALMNLCNFSRHKWGCYRFCVTGWALERWLIGYGWIIHLNHRIAAPLCGPRQWLSECWWAECWEQYGDVGEWKWCMLLQQTFLYQQKCFFFLCQPDETWTLALHFSSSTILHNKTFSPCSDVCWWIDLYCYGSIAVFHDHACFGRIDHFKALRLRQFIPDRRTYPKLFFTQQLLQRRWNCGCIWDKFSVVLISCPA